MNRSQSVKIANSLSESIWVYSGVRQGSVLGPTLFLLYNNDLVDCFDDMNCAVKLYADDVKLYSSFTLSAWSVDMDTAIQQLVDWAYTWQLTIAF
jgi:Reverse transcriptase (RNA-dependent DNA polymerase)